MFWKMIRRLLIITTIASFLTTLLLSKMIDSPKQSPPPQNYLRVAPKIHACVRTKDSIKYMEEFIKFHTNQGITSFSIYDDSPMDNSEFFENFSNIRLYKHVYGIKIRNENHFIFECMVNGVLENNDYILNMDDDEFLFPTVNSKINKLLVKYDKEWFSHKRCISNALYYFGTIKSNNTGLTTMDFVNRDRDYHADHFKYYFRSYSKSLKKRTEKAIFKVPKTTQGKSELISIFCNRMKTGVMIHGYSMNCNKQIEIKVAHYTRGSKEMTDRVTNFWKNVHGLEKRFSGQEKINNYIKERNRTEAIDMRLHDISNSIYNFQ